MTLTEIANYHGVSKSAVEKWPAEKRRKAIVIMQSGAEPEIIKLIGEISSLCYVFDCKHVVGVVSNGKYCIFKYDADSADISIYCGGQCIFKLPQIDLNQSTAVAELQKVKQTLESFVY